MRIAVIDLGTNTFNLLIVETTNQHDYTIIFEEKLPVKIGKGGIHNKTILSEAIDRAETVLAEHYNHITRFKAEKTYAFGTSALRDATNAEEFLNRMKKKFNLDITLIDGDKEAELIYKGVKQTIDFGKDPLLILDIGGGSNEFIICNATEILWKRSFDLGIARLLEMFHPSDPISSEELARVNAYFEKELQPLFVAAETYNLTHLAGASGTFDTLLSMISEDHQSTPPSPSHAIPLEQFYKLYEKLLPSNHQERLQMPGLDRMRIEMIVLAIHFVKFVIERLGIKQLSQSAFSLKEGVVFELVAENKKY